MEEYEYRFFRFEGSDEFIMKTVLLEKEGWELEDHAAILNSSTIIAKYRRKVGDAGTGPRPNIPSPSGTV